jgi:hypothetical protein
MPQMNGRAQPIMRRAASNTRTAGDHADHPVHADEFTGALRQVGLEDQW